MEGATYGELSQSAGQDRSPGAVRPPQRGRLARARRGRAARPRSGLPAGAVPGGLAPGSREGGRYRPPLGKGSENKVSSSEIAHGNYEMRTGL